MRFAGSKVEDFLSGRPNMGKLSQQGAILNSNEIAAGTEAQGMVAASGVAAQAKAKQAEILGAAQAQQAQSAATGQMWSSLGSSIAGGLGSINFGGSKTDFGTFGGSGTGSISGYTPKFSGSGLFG